MMGYKISNAHKLKKTEFQSISLLAIIIACICLMHACTKGKDCKTCTAKKNGQLITTQEICTDVEKAAFELAYVGHDINCR